MTVYIVRSDAAGLATALLPRMPERSEFSGSGTVSPNPAAPPRGIRASPGYVYHPSSSSRTVECSSARRSVRRVIRTTMVHSVDVPAALGRENGEKYEPGRHLPDRRSHIADYFYSSHRARV